MGYVILGLLVFEPQTLYGLRKQFERGISLFYSASLGGLRAALNNLLARGFVTVAEHVDSGRNKKTYTITDQGRAEFERWLLAPAERGANLEVVALSKVFFLGLLPSDRRAEVVADLRARAYEDFAELEVLKQTLSSVRVPDDYAEIFRFQVRTLDYGIAAHQAGLAWFDALAHDIDAR